MKYRKLRIAWSVVFGTPCLLMVAWWVRSYWYQDGWFFKVTSSEYVQCSSGEGRMCLWFEHHSTSNPRWGEWWGGPLGVRMGPNIPNRIPWFDVGYFPRMTRVYAAHCFLAMALGSLAAVVWCPRKFTIRGLLIATAAVAVILGAVIWVDKTF